MEEAKKLPANDNGKNQDSFQTTPFQDDFPLALWQGRTSSIIELSTLGKSCWIYVLFENPDETQKLGVLSQNNHEIIFFNPSTKKYLRLTNDCLFWSYHTTGPFQTIESGNWITKSQSLGGSDNGKGNFSYGSDIAAEIIKNIIRVEKSRNLQKKEEDDPEQEKKFKQLDLDSLRQQMKVSSSKAKENLEAWREVDSHIRKLYASPEIAKFKEVLIQSKGKEAAEIKKNEIKSTFEEILEVYGLEHDHLRNLIVSSLYFHPIESMNDVKFTLAVLLPEICIYPKELLQTLNIRTFVLCGDIICGGKKRESVLSDNKFYLNCRERSVLKIQQSFHENILERIEQQICDKLPEFKQTWESLKPIENEKVPKFTKEIFFGLIKNFDTISNHKDSSVVQKYQLLKDVLEAMYPNSIDEEWWDRVKTYEEGIKLPLE